MSYRLRTSAFARENHDPVHLQCAVSSLQPELEPCLDASQRQSGGGVITTLHRPCPFSNIGIMNDGTIVVAGATGNLGGRIVRALVERGASVKALVRQGTTPDRLERLQQLGVTIASVDLNSASQVTPACSGASCVVSALQGLRDVIVETQTVLLKRLFVNLALNPHADFVAQKHTVCTQFPVRQPLPESLAEAQRHLHRDIVLFDPLCHDR